MQDLSGHRTGLVGRQKNRGPGDLVGGEQLAAERDGGSCDFDQFGGAVAVARLGGVGETGRDRVDPDVMGGELEGERPGHRHHAALAGAIMDAAHRAAHRRRGEIDHGAGLSGRDQRLGHRDGREAAGLEVDVEHEIPIALAHLQERHPWIDAGIVDQDVGRAELAHGFCDHRFDLGELGEVGLDQDRAAAFGTDALGDRLRRRRVVEPVDRDVRALGRQCQCDRRADALLRARNQGDLACQFHAALISSNK